MVKHSNTYMSSFNWNKLAEESIEGLLTITTSVKIFLPVAYMVSCDKNKTKKLWLV